VRVSEFVSKFWMTFYCFSSVNLTVFVKIWQKIIKTELIIIKILSDDSTRVILTDSEGGDYINANFVNMEIPGSGVVNRYIATQGPLPNTVEDFWQMVHESQSSLVVMLTTVVERGRVKCHKYWPSKDEDALEVNTLQLSCNHETEDESFAFREFTLKNSKVSELCFLYAYYVSNN
jgi:protein tyrosine phosphatase